MTGTPDPVRPPPPGLLVDFACAMRADWDPDDLRKAITAAVGATWHPLDVTAEVWRLIHDPDGEPADLRNAARRPRLSPATGAAVAHRGAAYARELLAIRHEAEESQAANINERNQT